ncbi:MAG TPA: bile acid:sodium symporter family protein [Gammaproteobacteria bacterium]|nr:bile acid:sodium symporter family protein [Gammaproteobacteria bacterium]
MAVFRMFAGGLAPLTLLGTLLAFFFPPLFLWLKLPAALPEALGGLSLYGSLFQLMFALTMFALGLVLEYDDLGDTLRRPRRIFQGVATQYLLMPLLAFALISLTDLPPAVALGFLIVGSAPGAMASNVIVYLAGGALAFSIAMTTVATFLSPLFTPVLVRWLGGGLLEIDTTVMMVNILKMVVAPLALGMLLQPRLGRWREHVRELAPGVAALAIILICSYAVAANQTRITNMGATLVVLVVLLNLLGYLMGYGAAWLYRFDLRHRITLAIEIGMQNAGMGVALALAQFQDTPEAALPGALFAVWCILTAAGAASWLRRRERLVATANP